MRVAHLHSTDKSGGGAKIVRELHTRLNDYKNVESCLFVGEKNTSDQHTKQIPSLPLEKRFTVFVEQVLSLDGLGAPSSFNFPRIINRYNPDILHLHNLHGGFFNIGAIPKLRTDIPVIWTLHDMWPLTGRCTYSFDCAKFHHHCSNCPYLDTPRRIRFDSTKHLHRLKKSLFSDREYTFIAPSSWMRDQFMDSFLNKNDIKIIPHGIDINFFSPQPVTCSRRKFGISKESTVLLFIANGFDKQVKGMTDLYCAINQIPRDNVTILAIGDTTLPAEFLPDGLDIITPGYIDGDLLPAAYSAADLTIVPSLYESFGLVATESMACGTPAVAYATSGLKEQITESTGWLATPGDPGSLAAEITDAIENPQQLQQSGEKARRRVKRHYSQRRFVREYLQTYEQMLQS
jgi:glycosyltransferase involved in cell wall biosynthesis